MINWIPGFDKFTYDADGCASAKTYLLSVPNGDSNEYDRFMTSSFSTDGWSLVDTARSVWKRELERKLMDSAF